MCVYFFLGTCSLFIRFTILIWLMKTIGYILEHNTEEDTYFDSDSESDFM